MPISSSETPSSAAENFGPYFFAWVDEGDEFDPALHTRFDLHIFEFGMEQQEGDFASLSLLVQNPRVGLLAPGRQVWAWFSWWDGERAVPLMKGRLVGLPENLEEETVTLSFIARPSDFQAQKDALAATLRVAPFWDPIWFDESTRFEADNVLESRPEVWNVDPVSLVVTTSNIIDGEDGTAAFDEDQVFYDSLAVSYSQNPLRSVTMIAAVSWDQTGSGAIQFPNNGAGLEAGHTFRSYTGDGIFQDFPKPGASIGGGWSYAAASVTEAGMIDSALVGKISLDPANGDLSFYADGGFDTALGTYLDLPDGTHIGYSYHVAIPNVTITWNLALQWDVNRRKTENLTFTLTADVQDIITLADDGEALTLTMQSSEITNAVDTPTSDPSSAGGVIPIRSALNRAYFNTDRGAQSIEFLIAVARAHLLARARCVNVSFEIKLEEFVRSGITLRKNATIRDARLPGTDVGGKISSYSIGLRDGRQFAQISIACTIGKDGTATQIGGTPDWVDEGYVDVGYQTYSGQYDIPFSDTDVAYQNQNNVQANDDGINFHGLSSNVIRGFHLANHNDDGETQEDALSRWTITTPEVNKVNAECTRFAFLTYTVPDLTGGPFVTDYVVNTSVLRIPRTINLEAPSEGASS